MSAARFTELDWRQTPMGELTLRRRREPVLDVDVHEVKLGDEYLMSSLFTVAEVELARLGLACAASGPLDVVVGGLGLGYTARAALDDPRVARLVVVDALDAVIDWHERGLVPHAVALTGDPRVRLRHGDFFALATGSDGFDDERAGRPVDVVLLDIDHTPRHVLHPEHAAFYTAEGLIALARQLAPGGVLAVWSDDPPDEAFLALLREVFETATGHVVTFPNHLTGGESANSVCVAVGPRRR